MTKSPEPLAVRFIPAAELKTAYGVFGHFYSVQISRNQAVHCRSVLEIVSQDQASDHTSKFLRRTPDAVFIMMNPGSSQPLVAVSNSIEVKKLDELQTSLVPTKPDTTQYQVMRLMHYCGWRFVRVLNLSDLRCSKSGAFFQQYQALEHDGFDSHSIFSQARRSELQLKMTTNRKLPIICAWGVSPELDPLIERCTARIAKYQTINGLLKVGTSNKFLHPLPSLQRQKLLWVDQMVQQFTVPMG